MRFCLIFIVVLIAVMLSGCGSDTVLDVDHDVVNVINDINNQAANEEKPFDPVNLKPGEPVQSWEDFEAADYPVLAAIPERGIYLYAEKQGQEAVVYLQVGDRTHAYNWNYLTPRFILPQMDVADYDGDGAEELAVVLYIGSGTGVSVSELHVVDLSGESDDAFFADHKFLDYTEQLDRQVKFRDEKTGGKWEGVVTIGDREERINLAYFQDDEFGPVEDRFFFESIVRFGLEEGRLIGEFGAGLFFANVAPPQYVGTVTADIHYQEGQFTLSNLRFEAEEYVRGTTGDGTTSNE